MHAIIAGGERRDMKVVEVLRKRGADINTPGEERNTLLDYAVDKGHIELVQFLLREGSNTHAKTCNGSTPINKAIINGHKAIVRLLLDWDTKSTSNLETTLTVIDDLMFSSG
jgi:ankyrin repeat protein